MCKSEVKKVKVESMELNYRFFQEIVDVVHANNSEILGIIEDYADCNIDWFISTMENPDDYKQNFGYLDEKKAMAQFLNVPEEDIENLYSDNSYNWGCPLVVNYTRWKVYDTHYITIRLHLTGDVRANYGDTYLVEIDEHEVFLSSGDLTVNLENDDQIVFNMQDMEYYTYEFNPWASDTDTFNGHQFDDEDYIELDEIEEIFGGDPYSF